MHILLSNDDGFHAEGLQILRQVLLQQDFVRKITVIAPDRNQSGMAQSLTLGHPLRVHTPETDCFIVEGTPTDCVHLGLTGLLPEVPDMVISGINAGANLGDDVLYSGTVAAAREGRGLKYPSLAVSSVSFAPKYYAEAAALTAQYLAEWLDSAQLSRLDSQKYLLNLNIPDLPLDKMRGVRQTVLGQRARSMPCVPAQDPRGRTVYWVGLAGKPQFDAVANSDFHAVSANWASLTVLSLDQTAHSVQFGEFV